MNDSTKQYMDIAKDSTYEKLKEKIQKMTMFEVYKDLTLRGRSSETDLQGLVMVEGMFSDDFQMMLWHVAVTEIFKKLHEDFLVELRKEEKNNVADLS